MHEETAVSPEWGDRLGPDDDQRHQGQEAAADRGAGSRLHSPSCAAARSSISYFQAGKICDYINEKWGWDTLLAMLHDFGDGEDTAAVIRKELKIEPDEFDKQFLAHLEADTKNAVDALRRLEEAAEAMVDKLVKTKDWDAVIKEGTAIRDFYPDYVEEHSVYEAAGARRTSPRAISRRPSPNCSAT